VKKVIQFGAGNIGRGFLGQLYYESGFETVFIDINQEIVYNINKYRKYPIRIVDNETCTEIIVENIRALNVNDIEAISREICDAAIISTAVGVNNLDKISKVIAYGIIRRWEASNFEPINIIVCENHIEADNYLRNFILNELCRFDETKKDLFERTVGIVKAAVGRMVPIISAEMKEGHPLRIWTEPFKELPIDRDSIKGEIPKIEGVIPFSPFDYQIKKKIFLHNAGHAILAYLGYLKKYVYIHESCEDITINQICQFGLREVGIALSKHFNTSLKDIYDYINELMKRFNNKRLNDTIVRVAREPLRKLAYNDRLIGAAKFSLEEGCLPIYLCVGIAAALQYDEPYDLSAQQMNRMIAQNGIESVLNTICKLNPGEKIWNLIIFLYNNITELIK